MLDLTSLNESQLEAVTADDRHILVIAGAGSGKTRTIVYRLARIAEQGVAPSSILLLTFTKKASAEMQHRAGLLLKEGLDGVRGGTFHAFAYQLLRRFPPLWAANPLSVLDTPDSAAILSSLKDKEKIGKGDRSFPKNATILGLLSRARNKELPVEEILRREAPHLLPHAGALTRLNELYREYRHEHFLLDYDDLLFELEAMLSEREDVLGYVRGTLSHIMVDEYQDTNRVQARLLALLAGGGANVMVVGDDAQSIYAFRGATVRNILDFPALFSETRVIRLEENYRSYQPILDVANAVLSSAPSGFAKKLFTNKEGGDSRTVTLTRPFSDLSQAKRCADRIEALFETSLPSEIAVLFRAGYQSYNLEVELSRRGIPFKKYGGIRYAEASHIKDALAYARLLLNPRDLPAFERIAFMTKGVGPKTAVRLFSALNEPNADADSILAKYPELLADIAMLDSLRGIAPGAVPPPEICFRKILDTYSPKLEHLYPDDYPRRRQGLDELMALSSGYDDLALCLADLSLENPDDASEADDKKKITLSTVHSAKGLEWDHVLILDLVEDRFPSRHAMTREEDYEEERRLLYVAVTRARKTLDLFVPQNLYQRDTGYLTQSAQNPFVGEIPESLYSELRETAGEMLTNGHAKTFSDSFSFISRRQAVDKITVSGKSDADLWSERAKSVKIHTASISAKDSAVPSLRKKRDEQQTTGPSDSIDTGEAGQKGNAKWCRHKIFGRGKIVEELPPDKLRIDFPGYGIKIILQDYVVKED